MMRSLSTISEVLYIVTVTLRTSMVENRDRRKRREGEDKVRDICTLDVYLKHQCGVWGQVAADDQTYFFLEKEKN